MDRETERQIRMAYGALTTALLAMEALLERAGMLEDSRPNQQSGTQEEDCPHPDLTSAAVSGHPQRMWCRIGQHFVENGRVYTQAEE